MFSFLPTVLSFVTGLFKSKSSIMIDIVLGLVLVIVVGYGYNYYSNMKQSIVLYQSQLATQKIINVENNSKIEALSITNKNNIDKFKKTKNTYESNIKLLEQKYVKDIQDVKTITVIKERIKYVKVKDNGVTANVVIDTLNQIRDLNKEYQ